MRYRLTLLGSHIDKKLSQLYPELMRKFTKLNENLRWDNNFELYQIANMDKAQLFMSVINTEMIAKINSKEIDIKTHRKEFK